MVGSVLTSIRSCPVTIFALKPFVKFEPFSGSFQGGLGSDQLMLWRRILCNPFQRHSPAPSYQSELKQVHHPPSLILTNILSLHFVPNSVFSGRPQPSKPIYVVRANLEIPGVSIQRDQYGGSPACGES